MGGYSGSKRPKFNKSILNEPEFGWTESAQITASASDITALQAVVGDAGTITLDGTATAANPPLNFDNDLTTGIYRHSQYVVGVSCAGADVMNISAGEVNIADGSRLVIPSGIASTPSITFNDDTGKNTGIYRVAENEVGVSCNSANALTVSSTQLKAMNGTEGAPSVAFTGDSNTGIFSSGADSLGVSCGATKRLDVSTTALTTTNPISLPAGSAGIATSSLYFTGDTNTGIFSSGADAVGVCCGGTKRLDVSSTLLTTTNPIALPNGAVGAPALTFAGDTTTGIYSTGAGSLDLSVSGSNQLTMTTTLTTSANNIAIPDGTTGAAASAIYFANDTDVGIYRAAANKIGFNLGAAQVTLQSDQLSTSGTTLHTNATSNVVFQIGGVNQALVTSALIRPDVNDGTNLGTSGLRWGEIWCTNALNSSSDERLKEDIVDIVADYDLLSKLKPKKYKMKKRKDNKEHYGLVAQDFERDGIDIGFSKRTKHIVGDDYELIDVPGEYDYAIAYTELISPMIAIIKDLADRVDKLEKK